MAGDTRLQLSRFNRSAPRFIEGQSFRGGTQAASGATIVAQFEEGQILDVYEKAKTKAGRERVRVDLGWISIVSSRGRMLLEMVKDFRHTETNLRTLIFAKARLSLLRAHRSGQLNAIAEEVQMTKKEIEAKEVKNKELKYERVLTMAVDPNAFAKFEVAQEMFGLALEALEWQPSGTPPLEPAKFGKGAELKRLRSIYKQAELGSLLAAAKTAGVADNWFVAVTKYTEAAKLDPEETAGLNVAKHRDQAIVSLRKRQTEEIQTYSKDADDLLKLQDYTQAERIYQDAMAIDLQMCGKQEAVLLACEIPISKSATQLTNDAAIEIIKENLGYPSHSPLGRCLLSLIDDLTRGCCCPEPQRVWTWDPGGCGARH
jgi:hypothetical protein